MPVIAVNGLIIGVQVDLDTVAVLEGSGELDRLQAQTRELQPRVFAQLAEIRQVAAARSGDGRAARRVRTESASALGREVVPTAERGAVSSRLVSVRIAAVKLGRTPRQVTRLASRGVIAGDKCGGVWMLNAESVDRHLEQREARS